MRPSTLLPSLSSMLALLRRVAPSVDGSRYGYAAAPGGDVDNDDGGCIDEVNECIFVVRCLDRYTSW